MTPRMLLLLLLAAGLIIGALAIPMVLPPASNHAGPIVVEIPNGATPDEAGLLLERHGVVASARAFAWASRARGLAVRPGRYQFNAPVYPWYAARILHRGVAAASEIEVTIPEGRRLPEIARILDRAGVVKERDFLGLCRDPALVRELTGRDVESLEGYLFPDTYKFRPDEGAERVIRRMHARLMDVLGPAPPPAFDTHQWLTLASIVEREAAVERERPRIAAVFLNRLKRGMPLAADPTIRYALDKWGTEPVLFSDLEVESPYNTYRHTGLPPGPISSMGAASLEAVRSPLSTNDLFFVARGDGGHLFASTFENHRANIASLGR